MILSQETHGLSELTHSDGLSKRDICCTAGFSTQSPGPGCIKQLKIKWELVQLFSVFQRIFSHLHCVFHTLLSTFG